MTLYTIKFLALRGGTVELGDRFTTDEIESLQAAITGHKHAEGWYEINPEGVNSFFEWYSASFPDRDGATSRIVGNYLSNFNLVSMFIKPVPEAPSAEDYLDPADYFMGDDPQGLSLS
jgi:hypothetical protein